jgi:hypothetical protein
MRLQYPQGLLNIVRREIERVRRFALMPEFEGFQMLARVFVGFTIHDLMTSAAEEKQIVKRMLFLELQCWIIARTTFSFSSNVADFANNSITNNQRTWAVRHCASITRHAE